MKKFNVTGQCIPGKHYMVDISGKIAQIKELIDEGHYFTINRARQYGKTTMLYELRRHLSDEYTVVKISFEGLGGESFASAEKFCPTFIGQIVDALQSPSISVEPEYIEKWEVGSSDITDFNALGRHITKMCRASSKKIVLLIDEVDKTSNNIIFLHFLSTLRSKFLSRNAGDDYTFHSVILAGVYDIKNIKLKMVSEGLHTPTPDEDKIYNSPWNIAVDFEVDMSFNVHEISTMLRDYESDYTTGMDIMQLSQEIYGYTSGYPFLVSRICKHIDEKLNKDWTVAGVQEAVKLILPERNTLFNNLYKNLENNRKLYDFIYDILITGRSRTFSPGNPTIDFALMYGIIKTENGSGNDRISISNKIFEIIICDYFISKDEEEQPDKINGILQSDVLRDGRFDMELCLRKFAEHYADIYAKKTAAFVEREGKFLFITYLKPLLNGHGFYHFESQLSDERRMDIVVDFGREQFIIELKIWRGEKYEDSAHKQLAGYLDAKKADTGYLLTFDFRKGVTKERRAEWIEVDGKKIFDVIV